MIDQVAPPSTAATLDGLGARLVLAIARTGLSQSEFARRIAASPGFVSDVARGVKKPGAEFLHAVKTVFGISVDWLLTGDGTMQGEARIDLTLLRTIRLQLAVARSAVLKSDQTARALLLLIQDGRLQEAFADPVLQGFLEKITPDPTDFDLAIELYNGHLWTDEPMRQRNLMAAAIAHFETRKPEDNFALLSRAVGTTIQINTSPNQRNAGRDYYEG